MCRRAAPILRTGAGDPVNSQGHGMSLAIGWWRSGLQRLPSASVPDLPLAEAPLGATLGSSQSPPRAQTGMQLLAQSASSLDEQRHVDGLVAHLHLRVVGILESQPRRDLLGRPIPRRPGAAGVLGQCFPTSDGQQSPLGGLRTAGRPALAVGPEAPRTGRWSSKSVVLLGQSASTQSPRLTVP